MQKKSKPFIRRLAQKRLAGATSDSGHAAEGDAASGRWCENYSSSTFFLLIYPRKFPEVYNLHGLIQIVKM